MYPETSDRTYANAFPVPPLADGVGGTILVLDDSAAQRGMLCALLRRWGMEPWSSGDPAEALELARDARVGLVICDWMMPGMTGPEFCRRLRASGREGYAYVILLTSKSAEDALAEGLAAGADDFLSKPLHPSELRARLNAGARIVAMQRALVDKNHQLGRALSEIRTLYDAIDVDLEEARRLQLSFLPDATRSLPGVDLSLWLESSGHVGGDMVGWFEASRGMIGVHSIDVSGHGVASAMIGARVAGMLSGRAPEQNIALSGLGGGVFRALPPDFVATRLNALMLEELTGDRYLTLVLGMLDVMTGQFSFVQAGHPHPILMRTDGSVQTLGKGGLPIGLVQDATYQVYRARLMPGDRLIFYTDGLTECSAPDGTMLGEEGLIELSRKYHRATGAEFLERLKSDLRAFATAPGFEDDASALVLDYHGPPT